MIDYIGVNQIGGMVGELGAATFIERLAAQIEADYYALDQAKRGSSN